MSRRFDPSKVEIRIRPADRGDTRFLAWVIQEASRSHLERGVWDALVPDDERRLDFLEALARSEPRSFFHWQGFLVAEADGRQAAALTGYEPRLALPVLDAAAAGAMKQCEWSDVERSAYGARMDEFSSVWPELPQDRWIVEWVATAPEFRGCGIAQRLLVEILERGRQRGYRRAQIAYLIGNDPARRVYERLGFKTVDERRDAGFEALLGTPGIARMHTDLR